MLPPLKTASKSGDRFLSYHETMPPSGTLPSKSSLMSATSLAA